MVRKKCEFCDFVGHGHERSAHFATAHKATIQLKIRDVQERPEHNDGFAVLESSEGKMMRVWFDLPKGLLQRVQVYGDWDRKG